MAFSAESGVWRPTRTASPIPSMSASRVSASAGASSSAASSPSAATATISGSARFLLAKDASISAVLSIAVLASIPSGRPALLAIGRAGLEAATGRTTDAWDRRWEGSAGFRRAGRTVTAVWGVGLVIDAVLRVVVSYSLPIDVVPVVTALQWVVLLVVLNVISQVYLRRPAHRHLIFDDDDDDDDPDRALEPAALDSVRSPGPR